jgi:hypothetical protein
MTKFLRGGAAPGLLFEEPLSSAFLSGLVVSLLLGNRLLPPWRPSGIIDLFDSGFD